MSKFANMLPTKALPKEIAKLTKHLKYIRNEYSELLYVYLDPITSLVGEYIKVGIFIE